MRQGSSHAPQLSSKRASDNTSPGGCGPHTPRGLEAPFREDSKAKGRRQGPTPPPGAHRHRAPSAAMSAAGRSRRLSPACLPLPALPTARYFLCCRRPPAHVARGQAAPAPPSNGRYRPPGPCRPLTRRGRPSPAQSGAPPAPSRRGRGTGHGRAP